MWEQLLLFSHYSSQEDGEKQRELAERQPVKNLANQKKYETKKIKWVIQNPTMLPKYLHRPGEEGKGEGRRQGEHL